MKNYSLKSYEARTKMVNALHLYINKVKITMPLILGDDIKLKKDGTLIKKQKDQVNKLLIDSMDHPELENFIIHPYIDDSFKYTTYIKVQIGYNSSEGTQYITEMYHLLGITWDFKTDAVTEARLIMDTKPYPTQEKHDVLARVKKIRDLQQKIRNTYTEINDLCGGEYSVFVNREEGKRV